MDAIVEILARDLGQKAGYVENVVRLLDEGNTIPFIARYRKELHGAMDDTTLRNLETKLRYLRSLQERREEVLRAMEHQGKLTPALRQAVEAAGTLAEVEDLYRPYRPKRRTRATVAREKGLGPLAAELFRQDGRDPARLAKGYVNPELGVETVEEALAGASDILAEEISDDAAIRKDLRQLMARRAILTSRAASPETDSVYQLYYDFSCPATQLQGHQILALNRGEKEGFLRLSVNLPGAEGAALVCRHALKSGKTVSTFVKTAAEDAYARLIAPAAERELRNDLTSRASEGAIRNFSLNLKPLLLQPPVKGTVTMGLDPGYGHGCKVAVVDPTGRVLDTAVVYPIGSQRKQEEARARLLSLIRTYQVQHIAIGNGTASRETEELTADLIRQAPEVSYMIVNEAGASVYSASPLAAEEFPEYDVNLRSAVSIARRLQDPLAELVKIEPQAIGVGQYQHDMPQKRLTEALEAVVEDCVNAVGVDVNTASVSLLGQVAGLNTTTARNIVAYREANGPFTGRRQLLKVPKLGPKAFQQCAGFLRIPESRELLDHTGVHPESYPAAEQLLQLLGLRKGEPLAGLYQKVAALGWEQTAAICDVGVPTLQDIARELEKPGRDPRQELPPPLLRRDVMAIQDLKPGMVLTGTVRNVIDFGAFVDIGVHQDGLVHISQVTNRFIRHPSEVVHVGDIVQVAVLEVDEKRGRISLTMKNLPKEAR